MANVQMTNPSVPDVLVATNLPGSAYRKWYDGSRGGDVRFSTPGDLSLDEVRDILLATKPESIQVFPVPSGSKNLDIDGVTYFHAQWFLGDRGDAFDDDLNTAWWTQTGYPPTTRHELLRD